MTTRTKQPLTLANNIKETDMNEFISDWQVEVPQRPKTCEQRGIAVRRNGGDNRTAFILTTDLDSGNDAQNRAAVFGFDLQIRFPREGLPTAAVALFVALDELLLDAHGRREYLDWLRTLKLPFPIIILSYDFYLDPPTVERPGLMLAVRLDDAVFRTLRNGHIDPPTDQDEERKAA
jgi:hypothetical protein